MLSQTIEKVLGAMTERHHLGGAEKTCTSLDGVEATEDVVEQAIVAGALLEFHQFVIDAREQVRGFLQEVLQQLFHSAEGTHGVLLEAQALE